MHGKSISEGLIEFELGGDLEDTGMALQEEELPLEDEDDQFNDETFGEALDLTDLIKPPSNASQLPDFFGMGAAHDLGIPPPIQSKYDILLISIIIL